MTILTEEASSQKEKGSRIWIRLELWRFADDFMTWALR